jgi:hypothetical protein
MVMEMIENKSLAAFMLQLFPFELNYVMKGQKVIGKSFTVIELSFIANYYSASLPLCVLALKNSGRCYV